MRPPWLRNLGGAHGFSPIIDGIHANRCRLLATGLDDRWRRKFIEKGLVGEENVRR